jgi:hypothetical protein
MSITIKNRPYDNIVTTMKLTPVYNGLPFVVESTFKNKSSMRYIAEIYVNSIKVGELRHNPDIVNDGIGLFNVGRIIEGYIGYNLNWNIQGGTLAPQSQVDYYVAFGEEFSRLNRIKSITSYTGIQGVNRVLITFTEPVNLLYYDRILLQGTTVTGLNGYHRVIPTGDIDTVVLPDVEFTSQGNISAAYAIEGEEVKRFGSYVGPDGATYVALYIRYKTNPKFAIGDTIQIKQDTVLYTQYENIEWTILDITKATIGISSYSFVKTNIPYAGPMPTTTLGSIISRDNYVMKDQFNTKNDNAKTFNGAVQYEEYLNWTPFPYLLSLNSSKYLTLRPRKDINICTDTWMTLSLFGQDTITISTRPDYIMYETWSTPTGTTTFAILSNYDITFAGYTRTVLVVSGNQTSKFTNGSYLTISTSIGVSNHSRRVFNCTYDTFINRTLIVVEQIIEWLPLGSVTIDIKVDFNNIKMPTGRAEIPAGPKNLATIPAIYNGTAYKYKIWAYTQATTNGVPNPSYWFQHTTRSETFTFNLSCQCSKFKKFNLMWLNPLGGWDYHIFDKRSDLVRNIDRQQFTRHLNSYQGTPGYKYRLGDRGRTTYNTMSSDNWKLRTDFLSGQELTWLSYIYESPEVYWIDNENDKIYPVNLTNEQADIWNKTNYDEKATLYTYEIDIELANDRVVQRGGNINGKPGAPGSVTPPDPGGGGGGGGGGVYTGEWEPERPTWTTGWANQWKYTKSLYE